MTRCPHRLHRALVLGGWLACAGPLAAQEAPSPPPHPHPPHERLETLRLERMRHALALNDEQLRELRESLEASRRESREALARHEEAIRRLREELRREPVDQEAVGRALDALDAHRDEMARLRSQREQRLERILSPEQRAKFLLFNRQFDHRLRELIVKRRHDGPARPGHPGRRIRRPAGPGEDGPGAPREEDR